MRIIFFTTKGLILSKKMSKALPISSFSLCLQSPFGTSRNQICIIHFLSCFNLDSLFIFSFVDLTSRSISRFLRFLFLVFLVSEGLLFVSFFWISFHSLCSPTLGICLGEGFYLPDPCELTFGLLVSLSLSCV